jgi:hypothetical protein
MGSALGMGPVFWANGLILLGGAWMGSRRF